MKKRIAYRESDVHRKLEKLKLSPFDLSEMNRVERLSRLHRYIAKSQHFSLYYWPQRVDEEILDALQELSDQCDLIGQYKEMKAGAVMNAVEGVESEARPALHTACRDIFAKRPYCQEATDQAAAELDKLRTFLEELDAGIIRNENGESFHTLIHVGIGGSDLGPRSVYEALKPFGNGDRQVFFISNVDPDDTAAILKKVDLRRSLVNIVSKSGTTLETLTNEELVRQAFMAAGLDPAQHFLAVTGQGSPMDNPAIYLRTFYMFDYIGGRYSSTSMVGLVMLGFYLGYGQIIEFLRGASIVDYEAEESNIRNNPALLQALLGLWNHSYLNMATLAVLPYSQALHRFPAHLQQCDMESNGKSLGRDGEWVKYSTGPVVWGEPGTNGQHAFYQLLHQGTEIVPCEFIGFRKSQYGYDAVVQETLSQQKLVANLLAQSVALACGRKSDNPNKYFPGNRPNSVLLAERLTPETMGALLALYEAKIVFQGFAWNINSFDQEGVQLGKVLADRFLEAMIGPEGEEEDFEKSFLKTAGIV